MWCLLCALTMQLIFFAYLKICKKNCKRNKYKTDSPPDLFHWKKKGNLFVATPAQLRDYRAANGDCRERDTPRQCASFPTYPELQQKYRYNLLHASLYDTVFSPALACPAAIDINRNSTCTVIFFHPAAMLWNTKVNNRQGVTHNFLVLILPRCLDLEISVNKVTNSALFPALQRIF